MIADSMNTSLILTLIRLKIFDSADLRNGRNETSVAANRRREALQSHAGKQRTAAGNRKIGAGNRKRGA